MLQMMILVDFFNENFFSMQFGMVIILVKKFVIVKLNIDKQVMLCSVGLMRIVVNMRQLLSIVLNDRNDSIVIIGIMGSLELFFFLK